MKEKRTGGALRRTLALGVGVAVFWGLASAGGGLHLPTPWKSGDGSALAQALVRYHRGVTFLSGNTITPLLFNAFMQVNLEFWSGYIRSVGREESLRTLARFTDLIAAGEGDRAAQLLDDGLRRFVTTL